MKAPKNLGLLTFLLLCVKSGRQDTHPQNRISVSPVIPKTWDDDAMAVLEVPLANPVGSPKHVPAEYYYVVRLAKGAKRC